MKLSPCTSATTRLLSVLFFAVVVTTNAAEKDKPLVAKARTVAPAPAVPPVVELPEPPLSTFVVPRKIADGRDPFFPNSSRVYGVDSTVTNRAPTIVADLVLKGISGTTEQPLAIINTTTFTVGEINEVIIKNGRLRVQCLEINMSLGTALLQIGSERRELRLASSK